MKHYTRAEMRTMSNYQRTYARAINSGLDVVIGKIENAVGKYMIDEMPDPEVWQMLESINPTSDMKVTFLQSEGDIKEDFGSRAEMMRALEGKLIDTFNPNANYLIKWGDYYQTVDYITQLQCGWDDVLEEVLQDEIWGYLEEGCSEDLDRVMKASEDFLTGYDKYIIKTRG